MEKIAWDLSPAQHRDIKAHHHPHNSLIGLARLRLSGMVGVVYGEKWIFVYRPS